MLRIVTALSALLFVHVSGAVAQPAERPPNLNLGDAVVTGFSGAIPPDPARPPPANKTVADFTFIDPEGPSARVIDLNRPGYVWDGRLWQAPKKFDVLARDVGQVFGVAIDDQNPPNIYLAATSAFGLNIVLPARGRESAQRIKKGRRGAVWMEGQFGLDREGGPGSVWKVDGRSGKVSLLTNVMLDGVPNPGPGLGNIAYDSAHKQLFVSDLSTGMIHRIGLDGRDLGPPYDHGMTGRPAASADPVPFNPRSRLTITSERFDTENPDTWGFAQPSRRVWAVAIHEGRLYYSVRNGATSNGPQVWSVGLTPNGGFADDPRWELDVPANPSTSPVTDIVFSQRDAMILAQRGAAAGSYDYSALVKSGEPRVLRYWRRPPASPRARSAWVAEPEEYAIGFAGNFRNANGGVDLGYGYGPDGRLDAQGCEFSLWATGQNLRNNPALRDQLERSGPRVAHGLQGSPAGPVQNFNEPPWTSYFIDYDDRFDDPRVAGHVGGVRVYKRPCASPSARYGGPGYPSEPPYLSAAAGGAGGGSGTGDGAGSDCVGPNCAPCPTKRNPDGTCPPPPPPIDVLIIKENTPSTGAGDWFNITVGNIGPPIMFNPGDITVTDTIPAGMTVNSYAMTGSNWTCLPPAPPPFSGPQTITCTYNLGGTLGSPQALSELIYIHYTTTGPGPFVNCAIVAVPPSVGTDTNLPNNTSCVTVTPTLHLPTPLTCPQGTVLQNGQCVPTIKCDPPTIPNAAGTTCVCPPPMVSPAPGICLCQQGTMLQNGQCVPVVTACPKGTERKGRECVPVRDRGRPRIECAEGEVLKRGKCAPVRPRVEKRVRERRQIECGVGTVRKGGKCVRVRATVKKRTPAQEPERRPPEIRSFGDGGFPGGFGGGRGGGGFGGGGRR